MKKMLSLLLVLALVATLMPTVFAAEGDAITFTSVPESATVKEGNYIEFHVDIEGLTADDKVQWFYQMMPGGGWFPLGVWQNAYTDTMRIQALPKRDGFRYRCRVTDTATGTRYYSESAYLTVDRAPYTVIVSQPKDAYILASSTHRFEVITQGEGVTYQWQQSNSQGEGWNENSYDTWKVNYLDRGGQGRDGIWYRCKVTDANGYVTYTDAAVMNVCDFEITKQPEDVVITENGNVTFSVEIAGEYATVEWYYSANNGVSWTKQTGETSTSMTISSTTASGNRKDGRLHRVKITGNDGTVRYSEAGGIYYNTAELAITKNPESVIDVVIGDVVNFAGEATGSHVTYQWYVKLDGMNEWYLMPGETNTDLSVEVTDKNVGASYKLVASNPAGESVESAIATMSGVEIPELLITANPEDVTADLDTTATFTGAAEGDGVAYQWYVQAANSAEWAAVQGATAATLEVVASEANNGSSYKLVATDAHGQTAETTAAVLTVNLDIVFDLSPMGIPGSAVTGMIPAGATRVYTTMAGGCNLVIESENVSVAYNGTTYEPVDGVVTIALEFVNPRLGTMNTLEITNTGADAAAYTAIYEYALGTFQNPEIVEDISSLGGSVAAGNMEGYYIKWTAPEDGTLVLSQDPGWNILNDMVVTVGSSQKTMLADGVDGTLTYEVTAGDEFMIQLVAVEEYAMNEDGWDLAYDEEGNKIVIAQYPEAYVMANGTFETGSVNFPYTIAVDVVPGTVATPNVLTPGVEYYYNVQGGGVIMSIAADVTVTYNDVVYTAQNGVVTINLDELNFWAGITSNIIKVVYNGEEATALDVSFAYPAGHMENPDVLVEGDNVATLKAGNQYGYFYNFTATDKGVVTFTFSGNNGWSYTVNNVSAGTYGDNHCSADEPVVNSVSVNVLEGDVIQVVVNTFDANNPWETPAGDVTVNVVFEGLGDVDIEMPLPGIPEDGVED